MHAERLNTIARRTVAAYQAAQVTQKTAEIIRAAEQRFGNPSERAHDTELANAIKAQRAAINGLDLNLFPPTWRKMLAELGLGLLLPDELRAQAEPVIQSLLVEPDAIEKLRELNKSVAQMVGKLEQLRTAFVALDLGDDELFTNEVEFDVAMPREAIDDQLDGFRKELAQLNTQLLVLSSVAIHPPEKLTINSVSTNDFSLAININIDLGEIITVSLVALATMRLGYRKIINALKVDDLKDAPEEIMAPMKAWANGYVKDEIAKIVARLPTECPQSIDPVALNQHSNAVRAALEYIEERQERGFNMDVRVGPPDEAVDSENPPTDAAAALIQAKRARLQEIADRSAHLKVLEAQTVPILSLTDGSAPPTADT